MQISACRGTSLSCLQRAYESQPVQAAPAPQMSFLGKPGGRGTTFSHTLAQPTPVTSADLVQDLEGRKPPMRLGPSGKNLVTPFGHAGVYYQT